MKEKAIEILKCRMKESLFCCGLDPDLKKIPAEITTSSVEEKVVRFLKGVIDATASHVCAYKAQKAYFDLLPDGNSVLSEVVAYVHDNYPNIPVVLDCKIGDIENTMKAYLECIFGTLKVDGVVVNPYMGDDVMRPMAQYPNKAIVVLVKTSNFGGGIVQDIKLEGGILLWQYILQLTVGRWNAAGNMIPVLSSTARLNMVEVRKMIPDDMPILLAGIGAQGGSLEDLSKLLNSENSGVFVNSSREIIYTQRVGGETWQEAVERSAIKFKDDLNKERNR
jgi:orotidine-5'-phosphate decarboxylase